MCTGQRDRPVPQVGVHCHARTGHVTAEPLVLRVVGRQLPAHALLSGLPGCCCSAWWRACVYVLGRCCPGQWHNLGPACLPTGLVSLVGLAWVCGVTQPLLKAAA